MKSNQELNLSSACVARTFDSLSQRLVVWITPANDHHDDSAIGIWIVCGRSMRGNDFDQADELLRASSLAGKGVDISSRLLELCWCGLAAYRPSSPTVIAALAG